MAKVTTTMLTTKGSFTSCKPGFDLVPIGGKKQCLKYLPNDKKHLGKFWRIRSESEADCKKIGARLPLPKNKAENDDLVSVAKKRYKLDLNNYFKIAIDLNDVANEGEFVTSNGLKPLYTNWQYGFPKNGQYKGKSYGEHDFGVMLLSNGRWLDFKSTEYSHLICQQFH